MANRLNISWPRIAAEGTAIVFSILLAFWIQAWWEKHQVQDFRQTLLTSLLVELREIQAALDFHDVYYSAIQESARQLVNASIKSDNSLGDREIDKLLFDICFYDNGETLNMPTLASILSSGNLSLIYDNELRAQLREWPALLSWYKVNLLADYNFAIGTQMEFLIRSVDLPQIYTASNATPGLPNVIFPIEKFEIEAPISHAAIIEDREFKNIVTERINRISTFIGFQQKGHPLQDELAGLIAGIERELLR